MKAKLFVQGLNVVPSSAPNGGRVVAVTLGQAEPEAAAGLAPHSAIQLTVTDASAFAPGSEHVIEINPAK